MPNEVPDPNGNDSQNVVAPAAARKRPSNFWLIIVAALFIIVPFSAWYFTWFGRNLSDHDIATYLSDQNNPRHIQHALSQVETRMEGSDPSVKKFYPQIIAASKSPVGEVRKTAAWVMGQDNKSEEFHAALMELLPDKEPLVRRNAALQLVRFGDARGRAELRTMLQPYPVNSLFAGRIVSFLPAGSKIRAGAMLARIRDSSSYVQEIRSPVDGVVSNLVSLKEGDQITVNQTVAWIAPDRATISDALRALGYVGTREDIAVIQSCVQSQGNAEIAQEAGAAAKMIEARSPK